MRSQSFQSSTPIMTRLNEDVELDGLSFEILMHICECLYTKPLLSLYSDYNKTIDRTYSAIDSRNAIAQCNGSSESRRVVMHDPQYTDQSSTGLSRLIWFNSTYVLTERHLNGERDEAFFNETLQDVSLTHPDSLPFVEFIPATQTKSPPRLVWIVGVVILVAVLGVSSAIAFSRDNGFVLSLVNSPQTLTTDK